MLSLITVHLRTSVVCLTKYLRRKEIQILLDLKHGHGQKSATMDNVHGHFVGATRAVSFDFSSS
jgi:hypothetical protein